MPHALAMRQALEGSISSHAKQTLITITIQKSTRTELAAAELYILSNRPVQFIELFRSTPGLASLKLGIWLLILVRDMIIVSPFTLPLHCPLSSSNFSDRHSHPTPAGLVPSVPATIPVFSLSPVPVSCRLLCTTHTPLLHLPQQTKAFQLQTLFNTYAAILQCRSHSQQ